MCRTLVVPHVKHLLFALVLSQYYQKTINTHNFQMLHKLEFLAPCDCFFWVFLCMFFTIHNPIHSPPRRVAMPCRNCKKRNVLYALNVMIRSRF